MAGTVQIKRGSGAPSSLLYGELAFDNTNKILYVGQNNTAPLPVGGSPSNFLNSTSYIAPIERGGTGTNSVTADRVVVSTDNSLTASNTTVVELGYLSGVTSSIQNQLNGKSAINHAHNYALSSSAGGSATSVGFTLDNTSTIYLGGTVSSNNTSPRYNDKVSMTGGILTALGFSGSLTGNATTASTLQNARSISMSGGAVGTPTLFNGSANVTIPITALNASFMTLGTVPFTVLPIGTNSSSVSPGDHSHSTYALSSSPTGSASAIASAVNNSETLYMVGVNSSATESLKRNTSITFAGGNISATTFIGALSGNATSANTATNSNYASALYTSRNFSISGGVTASAIQFNGSNNVALNVTAVDPTYLNSPVSVEKGGTGSNTAAGGLTNLGVFFAETLPATGVLGQICLIPA